MTKQLFISNAKAQGLTANYSGKDKTMYLSGQDKAVKTFIRVCNLKGKKAYSFNFAQKN